MVKILLGGNHHDIFLAYTLHSRVTYHCLNTRTRHDFCNDTKYCFRRQSRHQNRIGIYYGNICTYSFSRSGAIYYLSKINYSLYDSKGCRRSVPAVFSIPIVSRKKRSVGINRKRSAAPSL